MSGIEKIIAHADKLRAKTGVTDKLSIVDMTRLLDDLKWGQENLLKGTSNQFRTLTGQGWLAITTASSAFTLMDGYNEGELFTYSATITNSTDYDIWLEAAMLGADGNPIGVKQAWVHSPMVKRNTKDQRVSAIVRKPHNGVRLRTYITCQGGYEPAGTQIQVKDERLYIGTEPGVWTPNPADKVGG